MTKKNIKKITDGITYGFEIEGAFSNDIVDYLVDNCKGTFCGDGSVVIDDDDIPSNDFYYNSDYQEFKSNIIRSYDKMIELLGVFDRKNYIFNNTCGLHIHLAHRDLPVKVEVNGNRKKPFLGLMSNYKLINEIQQNVRQNTCTCQADRLSRGNNSNGYYRDYSSLSSFKRQIKYSEKYKFCRYHPQGTLEFRYLSPCYHRVHNVKRLVNIFIDYLLCNEKIRNRNAMIDTDTISDNVNISLAIKKNDNINIELGKLGNRNKVEFIDVETGKNTEPMITVNPIWEMFGEL